MEQEFTDKLTAEEGRCKEIIDNADRDRRIHETEHSKTLRTHESETEY
jgi:hypothetical protein